jgi:hypothetical protein
LSYRDRAVSAPDFTAQGYRPIGGRVLSTMIGPAPLRRITQRSSPWPPVALVLPPCQKIPGLTSTQAPNGQTPGRHTASSAPNHQIGMNNLQAARRRCRLPNNTTSDARPTSDDRAQTASPITNSTCRKQRTQHQKPAASQAKRRKGSSHLGVLALNANKATARTIPSPRENTKRPHHPQKSAMMSANHKPRLAAPAQPWHNRAHPRQTSPRQTTGGTTR